MLVLTPEMQTDGAENWRLPEARVILAFQIYRSIRSATLLSSLGSSTTLKWAARVAPRTMLAQTMPACGSPLQSAWQGGCVSRRGAGAGARYGATTGEGLRRYRVCSLNGPGLPGASYREH